MFLHGTRDKEASVRASSLSNLGELCKLLHYALPPFVRDVLDCVYAVLNSETDEQVRRGERDREVTM